MKSILVLLTAMASLANISIDSHKYCEFSIKQYVIQERSIRDFSDNEFKLYELEHGYAIYEIINNEEVFVEGSYKVNSPYYEFQNKHIYYLGLGNYYYTDDDNVININTRETINLQEYSNCTYSIEQQYVERQAEQKETNIKAATRSNTNYVTDDEGFFLIPEHEYFRRLNYFPTNYQGTCAVVAISMLLGYYDNFYNASFIPSKKYNSRTYTTIVNEESGELEWDLDNPHFSLQDLTRKVNTVYKNTQSYSHSEWTFMPGTTQAMHDLLLYEYGVDLDIFDDDGAQPMTGLQIYQTINRYLNGECSQLKQHVSSSFGTSDLFINISSKILSGNPVLASFISLYNGNQLTEAHTTLIYGFGSDGLMMHFGWGGNYSEMVISTYLLYSYYALSFDGDHIHSTNVQMEVPGVGIATICGCGEICWPLC